ncbi:MAG: hydroxyacid dehydrogenase [Acetobacteraceae bacterium]|nr:hydroxyacid dehydrogenase [Acetobacteraceae bacterium]
MTANRKKVLVPDTLGPAGLALLEPREDIEIVHFWPGLDKTELHAVLRDAVAIVLSYTRFGAAEVAAAPVLQVVARIGVGFDSVEIPPLTARGIPLMIAGTANSTSVAEHAVFLILALAKRALELDRRVRQGLWHERKGDFPIEVSGKTVLVIGFGRIGTRTAPRCRALGLNVLVYDPYIPAATIRDAGYEPVADLDAALPRADFVSVHCPKSPETTDLFDAARLARMKPGSFLINTARGGIVNEAALYDALVSGHLAAAGLDVFATEPAQASNQLFSLDTVLLTPHMAGVTVEAVAGMAEAVARNVLSVLDGQPIRENVVNQEVLR